MSALLRFAIFTLASFSTAVLGFETPTHYAISLAAAQLAIDDGILLRLGRNGISFTDQLSSSPDIDDDKDLRKVLPPCKHAADFDTFQLVACGAMFEDFYTLTRSIYHFLDPQHLDANGNGKPLFVGPSAAEWALKDHPEIWPVASADPQHYSYRDAETYLWTALTYQGTAGRSDDAAMRERYWGLTFQSLGQMIHLVQDMASPQHTRNEPHYDKLDLGRWSQRSRYEQRALDGKVSQWIDECLVHAPSSDCKYNPATSILPVYPAFASRFQQPRAFWENGDMSGLAQVTSRSFLSPLRNFVEPQPGVYNPATNYPFPNPVQVKDISLQELTGGMPDKLPPFITAACNGDLNTCKMRMIGTAILDPLSSTPLYNDRASTESIFDQDLKKFNTTAVVYDPLAPPPYVYRTYSKPVINRFNIDRAYSHLIPRAVSYSAGFLNFYFRGELAIAPPPTGVYSTIDDSAFSSSHPTDVQGGLRGFGTIRLSLANSTSSPAGAPPQLMTDGKLWAILKFQRNACYADSLDDMGDGTKPLADCIGGDEEIVVSDPVDRTGVGREVVPRATLENPEGEGFEFNFPNQLPINAWNVLLQVVFRGTLGTEANKIVVSTVDISEPTFFSVFNNTDYVYLGGACYTPQQVKADPNLWKRVSSACLYPAHAADILNDSCFNAKYGLQLQDVASDPPTLVISNEAGDNGDGRIPPRRFSRFAILADTKHDVNFNFHFWNPTLIVSEDDKRFQVSPFHAHKSRVTPGLSVQDRVISARGVSVWNGIAFMMDVEKGAMAEDDGSTCIGGGDNSLSPLAGEERYPVPSQITYSAP